MTDSRNNWMDTVRGLAALGVALYHFDLQGGKITGYWLNELTGWGSHGVAAFFVISGFCIQMISRRVSGPAEFFWQRFWRIYPPFLLSLVVIASAAVVRQVTHGANDAAKFPRDAISWLATLAIMARPATPIRSLNWVNWSLSFEVMFYLVAGLLLFMKRGRIGVAIALTAVAFIPGISEVPGLFFLDRWSAFALGMGLYELMYGRDKKESSVLIVLCTVQIVSHFLYRSAIVSMLTFLTILISIRWPQSFLSRRNWFTDLGKFSYSFFLLHVPVGVFMFVGAQEGLMVGQFPRSLLIYLADLALCLGVAYLAYLLVEKPSMNIGKHFARVNAWSLWKRTPIGKTPAVVRVETTR